jgi:enoyl-CoA hydratase/carnithine racemase
MTQPPTTTATNSAAADPKTASGVNTFVTRETIDCVAVLTLTNPSRRNALSRDLLSALRDHLGVIAKDSSIKCVILRAAGAVFSSGHDLREIDSASPQDAASLFALCTEVMESIRLLPVPVIAEVEGLATAAGCQLVATCDLVVAAETASFATPGVRIGLFCSTPAVALSRAVNTKKAMEMLLTGDTISAAEAERIGLVNRVVPRERLADETLRLAQHIATASRDTLVLGKRAFYEQLPHDQPQAYEIAERAMVENAACPDAHEGMRAFLEKRAPQWRS